MKRVYVGPFDEVEVVELDAVVARGEAIEVTAEMADRLDEQPDNWAKPSTNAAKEAEA